MNNRSVVVLLLFVILLIVFDASQQKFYIDTFKLSEATIPLSQLVANHFIRWAIWAASCVPFGYFIWRKIEHTGQEGKQRLEPLIGALIIPSLFLVLILISVLSLLMSGLPITGASLKEFGIFFFYQKGITFFMAYVGVALYLFSYAKSRQIDTQWLEIKGLREARKNGTASLTSALPQITVKTGNRVKPILIQDIRWIQADDYCVRIHTEARSYCLRKSLKFLEGALAPYRFVRIHRSALINLDYIDHINYELSLAVLRDQSAIPISRTGGQLLREHLKQQTA